MLQVSNLHKSYDEVHALKGVDFSIEPGEIVALLGHNGAGKTTLVSIVAGLRRPNSGTVHVAGIDVVRRPYDARMYLGLAPQDLGVYMPVSVKNNLSYFGQLSGLKGRQLATRIDEVAEGIGLTELLDRDAAKLSGGEKRRLHTAIALMHKPPLLLLDEPTTGADVTTRARLVALVRDLATEGTAICYSTHYLGEVETLNARVAILERGEFIANGPISDLVARHGTSTVEMSFDGPPPPVPIEGATAAGSVIRIQSDDAAAAAASALAALGAEAARLRTIEIVRPSLESVYLSLTGRRYEREEEGQEEVKV